MANPLDKYLPQAENPLSKYLTPTQTQPQEENPLAKYEGQLPAKTPSKSVFRKTMEMLDKPSKVLWALMEQRQAQLPEYEKDHLGLPIFSKPLKGKKVPTEQEVWNAGLKAWRGEDKRASGEIIDQMREKAGLPPIWGLGFALNIATDPLIAFGAYSKAFKGIGKGIKGISKVAKKIPAINKATQAVVAKTGTVIENLQNLFVTKTGVGKLGEIIEKHLLKREYLKGKEIKFATKTKDLIQKIAHRTGQSIDDVDKQIISVIEQPHLAVQGIHPEIQALANTIKSHLSNLLTTEMKAGVPITSLSQGAKSIQYFPRITTREAQAYLKQASKSGFGSKAWNPKIANSLRRKTGDFTLQEFNDFVASHGLESLGGRSVEQFFMRNPPYAIAIRGMRSAKAVTSAEFLKDVSNVFGQPASTAPAWYKSAPESLQKILPAIKHKKFPPEVMSEINRVTNLYINPQELGIFRKVFDVIQNSWKRWTLAPFPKYHLRNMVGNIWNNYLAGVSPKSYPKAQALQMYRKYKGTGGKVEKWAKAELGKFGLTSQMADDLIVNAEMTGVLGRGWYAADIEVSVAKQVTGRKGIISRGMAVGSTIENNARLAHFVDKLDKGDDIYKAAHSVKKFLFDYQDLTSFEKQVMKRLFPFYTWTRKNIPLQFEQIWKQPEKFARISPLFRGRDEASLLRLKYAKPQLYERLPVELRRDIDTITYVPLEGLLPAADLAKLVRPQEILVELASPFLRAPIEMRMNKSFYFESEIQRYDEQTQELLRADIPVRIKYLMTTILPQARLLNEVNKLVKKDIRKEKLTPEEQAFALSLSSVYKINTNQLRISALRVIMKKVEDLKSGARWAAANKRPKEVKRIRNTIQEVLRLIKDIK